MAKKSKNICIVGLGYVGLPLAIEFSNKFNVIGFDINKERIKELSSGFDRNHEVSKKALNRSKIRFTYDESFIASAEFIIVAVPTPITPNRQPDLRPIRECSKLVGKNLSKGSIVIYESTVYPGVTEEICKPILEKYSRLKCPSQFKLGYSPERINPGDKVHTVDKIKKIVSAIDKDSLRKVSKLYGSIITAGVFEASCIRVAEAAKVVENTQRDLNIALMNELSIIFNRMGIDTFEVITAASTKWNFHRYRPGLVGGHCISVDPHYLLYKAKKLGYSSRVILAGRDVSESIPKLIAKAVIRKLNKIGRKSNKRILIMGLSFKENINDTRNTKTSRIISELKKDKAEVYSYEPLLNNDFVKEKFGVENISPEEYLSFFDAVIITVPHTKFKRMNSRFLKSIMRTKLVFDVPRMYDKLLMEKEGFIYMGL